MKLRVVKTFADKELKYKMYAVGEIVNLPDSRAETAINKGLAVEIAEAKVEKNEKPTTAPKKKATTKKG